MIYYYEDTNTQYIIYDDHLCWLLKYLQPLQYYLQSIKWG